MDSYTVGADNLDSVLKKLPNQGAAILLAHEPDFAKISSESGRFGLQISGHSHGGQFIIPGTNIAPFRGPKSTRYPVGKYKVKKYDSIYEQRSWNKYILDENKLQT